MVMIQAIYVIACIEQHLNIYKESKIDLFFLMKKD